MDVMHTKKKNMSWSQHCVREDWGKPMPGDFLRSTEIAGEEQKAYMAATEGEWEGTVLCFRYLKYCSG